MENLDSRFHNVTEFAKYFKMFCLIVENCTPQIAQTYYNFFETQVLNVVLHNEIRHQHQLAFSVLQTIAEITTIKTMERVFDNECFTICYIDLIPLNYRIIESIKTASNNITKVQISSN